MKLRRARASSGWGAVCRLWSSLWFGFGFGVGGLSSGIF